MSKTAQHAGSTKSYVTGFVLSIICTVIPYYLVVNKTVTGNHLLGTIIGFALLQMLIQIFFFLHLGRGPKPIYNVAFFAATVGLILVVVGGSIYIMDHLHYNMSPAEVAKQQAEGEGIYQVEGQKTGACQLIKINHQVIITHGKMSPLHTDARLCDTLSFVNKDSTTHTISFGTITKPGTYAGQSDQSMRKGLSQTITLNQTGAYQFYDHQTPALKGSFTVAR